MLLALFLACKDGTTPLDDSGPLDSQEDPSIQDRQTFQAMLDGDLDADEGFLTISQSGGWPIQLGAGLFLFAAPASKSGVLSLAGDHSGWELQDMAVEAGIWWVEAEVPDPKGSLYKFVWDSETYVSDAWSRAYGEDEYGEYSLVRGPGGHLERWFQMGGDSIEPRMLHLWVPTGEITHHLYVHDGQNLFDPEAIWGGWHLQEALGAHTLAIGLDNTPARIDEYTHVQDFIYNEWMGGLGDAYADFVVDDVRPLMERAYGDPQRVGVMGSSLGGLISMHIVQRHAGAFDFAASLSGTLGWGSIDADNQTLIQRYAAGEFTGVSIYLDSGGGPGEGCIDSDGDGTEDDSPDSADNYCETRQMADLLAEKGWTWETDLWHWWEPDAPHNEAAWADRVALPVGLFEGI